MLSTREIVVWSEVVAVLGRKIDLAVEQAAAAKDLREMGFAQGLLSAYRDALKIPAGLVAGDEMDKAEKKNREAAQASQDPRTWSLLSANINSGVNQSFNQR